VFAAPDYVGINVDDEFIWSTDFDEDQARELYLDLGYNDTDFDIDDDDIEGVKLVILRIEDEDEHNSLDGAEVTFNYYETEQFISGSSEWSIEDRNEDLIIYDYTTETEVLDLYMDIAIWGAYFADKDTNWYTIASEWNDDLDDEGEAEYNGNEFKLTIEEFFYNLSQNEIEVTINFNNQGVLEYYHLEYDGDTVLKMTLESSLPDFLPILIIIIMIIIAIIILGLVLYFIFRKPKQPKSKAAPAISQVKTTPQKTEKILLEPKEPKKEEPPKTIYCPYCGSPTTPDTKYCEFCGKNLID
jgi:hypothetical protein